MNMNLAELPTEIILLVFPYLTACDFLSFTSCTKRLLSFSQEPSFWRILTTRTFRIPSQPLLHSDGARWQWLHKALLTRAYVYTWGNSEKGSLGHTLSGLLAIHHRTRAGYQGWPNKIEEMNDVGVVADVQCGGWSTVILNSVGQLFICGVVDGEKHQIPCLQPTLLRFPPGYPPTTSDRYEPDTAIKQYSVGRSRVLGLSDSGKMWEWANGGKPGLLVKLVTVDVAEGAKFGKGRATQVISGWAGSSAYINGAGIVIWDRMPELDEASLIDAYLMESFTIPGTSFKRNQADLHSDSSLESCIGEVLNHIVLENSIVFITHLNKVFAYHLSYRLKPGFSPVELTTFRQTSLSFRIEDIQGSFHNFGVFSRDGAVLLGDTTLINSFIDASIQSPNFTLHPRNTRSEAPLPQPFVPSALQCTSVVSLAFGDYHYHALHADGTISSHGTEPLACGAFGLGYQSLAMVRGVHYASWEGIIPTPSAPAPSLQSPSPDNLASLKTIWFETEKAEWLRRLHSYSAVAEKYRSQNMMNQEPPEMVQSFREWIERQGCAWHLGPLGRRTRKMPLSSDMTSTYITSDSDSEDHPDKGAYFAVKVSAAGWHSAALVLVDTEKAERVRRKYIVSSSASGATPNTGANVEEASCRVSLPPSSETTASASSGSNLRGIGTSLHQAGRRFLGLTLRDEMQAEISRNHASAEAAQQSRTPRYVWDDIPFPRLVGLDGWERKRGADGGFG